MPLVAGEVSFHQGQQLQNLQILSVLECLGEVGQQHVFCSVQVLHLFAPGSKLAVQVYCYQALIAQPLVHLLQNEELSKLNRLLGHPSLHESLHDLKESATAQNSQGVNEESIDLADVELEVGFACRDEFAQERCFFFV